MAKRATGGEEWVLECAVSVVDRWMGHRAVRGWSRGRASRGAGRGWGNGQRGQSRRR